MLERTIPSMRGERFAQAWRQPAAIARGEIRIYMADTAHPGNRRADRIVIEDESQRELRKVHAVGHERREDPAPCPRRLVCENDRLATVGDGLQGCGRGRDGSSGVWGRPSDRPFGEPSTPY